MKKNFLFVIFLFFSTTTFAQIDWDSYKEPDGSFQRLFIDPNFRSITNNDDSNIDLYFNTTYINRFVKDRSILVYQVAWI